MTDLPLPQSSDRNRSGKASILLAILVAAGGLIVILGWVFNLPALKGLRPGLVEMKFNTAACFLAVGLATILVSCGSPGSIFRKIGYVLSGLTALLAGLTFLQYVVKIDLHVDQLFHRDDPNEVGTTSPGRMALVTTVCFVLGAVGVMTVPRCRGGRSWPVNACTSLLLALAIPSLVGYVYGIRKLYGVAGSSEMALHTAMLFIAVAASLMTACPGSGLMVILTSNRAGGYFARRVLPAAVLIPVALGAVLAVGGNFGTGDTAYAATLAAVVFLFVFVAFLWFTAVMLDKVDARRIDSEREIAARVERDKAADQLRESEKRFRELADAMPQLVWTCDANGSADYWNRRSAAYLGRPVLTLLRSQWTQCVHPDDLPQMLEAWGQAVHSSKAYEVEYRLKVADGSYRWQLARGLPSTDTAGKVTRWFGTCTDINDQRKMLEDLKAADKLKDQFLATMSHELRTPLTSILGWSTLLKEPNAPADMFTEAIDAIHRNAVAQTRLVEDLLDMSRIVQGRLRIEPKPIDLTAVVEEAVRTASHVTHDRVAAVDLKLAPTPVWIHGDPDRCRQVVINLVNNAIKFGDATKPPEVSLAAERTSAVLTVTNAGEGISADFMPHLFERFRQQDGTTTRRHQGLGLGLSIVKSLVDLHGGTIEAASDGPGTGARFTATFPIIAPPAAA
jgi:PAS domain S-box-containing protein